MVLNGIFTFYCDWVTAKYRLDLQNNTDYVLVNVCVYVRTYFSYILYISYTFWNWSFFGFPCFSCIRTCGLLWCKGRMFWNVQLGGPSSAPTSPLWAPSEPTCKVHFHFRKTNCQSINRCMVREATLSLRLLHIHLIYC